MGLTVMAYEWLMGAQARTSEQERRRDAERGSAL
jgi:hypothetical protein